MLCLQQVNNFTHRTILYKLFNVFSYFINNLFNKWSEIEALTQYSVPTTLDYDIIIAQKQVNTMTIFKLRLIFYPNADHHLCARKWRSPTRQSMTFSKQSHKLWLQVSVWIFSNWITSWISRAFPTLTGHIQWIALYLPLWGQVQHSILSKWSIQNNQSTWLRYHLSP